MHYHLTPGSDDPHSLHVKRVGNQFYICTNHRCFGLNRNMAEQLQLALTMVLFDRYEIASTEPEGPEGPEGPMIPTMEDL